MNPDKEIIKIKIIELLEENSIVQVVLNKIGVKRPTFYRWLNEDKDYKKKYYEAIKIGEQKTNDFVESKLFDRIQNNDVASIKYYLACRHPKYKNSDKYLSSMNRLKKHELEKKEIEFNNRNKDNDNSEIMNSMINLVKDLEKEKRHYEMLNKKSRLTNKKSQKKNKF